MPNKEFLETYPLYKNFELESIPELFEQFEKVAIKMQCSVCDTEQTFVVQSQDFSYKIPSQLEQLYGQAQPSLLDQITGFQQSVSIEKFQEFASILKKEFCFHSIYVCTHCQQFQRYFYIKVDKKSKSIRKVGQYPSWEIKGNRDTKYFSIKHSDYFKKGLICESQAYGIAAFSYYRRIIEEVIDKLLDDIPELLSGEELEKYKIALQETKQTIVTQEKIALVKDLLPSILRPNDINPLAVLHSTLSEGLHAESDDECLQYAMQCRESIVFLVNQINISKTTSRNFTDNMKNLLDKKALKGINKK